MPIAMDDQKWPLVHCRWGRTSTDRDLQEWFEALDRFLDRGERFGIVIDARYTAVPKPAQRTYIAQRIKEQAPRSGQLMIQALVLTSPIQRSFLGILNWIVKQPYEQRAFGTVAAAEAWVRTQLRIPPRASL